MQPKLLNPLFAPNTRIKGSTRLFVILTASWNASFTNCSQGGISPFPTSSQNLLLNYFKWMMYTFLFIFYIAIILYLPYVRLIDTEYHYMSIQVTSINHNRFHTENIHFLQCCIWYMSQGIPTCQNQCIDSIATPRHIRGIRNMHYNDSVFVCLSRDDENQDEGNHSTISFKKKVATKALSFHAYLQIQCLRRWH